jgi:hypothetical protein
MNRRLWELDALRGLMLVLMTVTHLPTRFSDPLGQPFGFVSAAEGFVMLSGLMAGMVYTAKQQRDGEEVMREAFLKRALKIYLCQAVLLVFLFTVVALVGVLNDQAALKGLISFYLDRPLTAVVASLLLVHSPPLLDILPMYIVFMLASPLLLMHGLQHGWKLVMSVSVAVWFAAQFGLADAVYDTAVALTGLSVPREAISSFDLFAWQFLWVMGLWAGSQRVATKDPVPVVFPPWMVRAAIVIGVTCLVWRHAIGQTPFPDHAGLNLMFNKWHLGPLRLIDFFALVVLAMHFAPRLRRLPRIAALETMGAQALPVFCAHLVPALALLAWSGDTRESRPWAVDTAILVASFAILYAVAWGSTWLDRRTAAIRARERERWTARGQRLSEASRRTRVRANLRSGPAAGASHPPAPRPHAAPGVHPDAAQ